MDSISASLITAISSGGTAVEVKEVYSALKLAIKEILGISKSIDALEKDPKAQEKQSQLAEALTGAKATTHQELNALAMQLIDALKDAQANHPTASKYRIDAANARIGVIGDNARIYGGIHNHYGGAVSAEVSKREAPAPQPSTRQGDKDDAGLIHILHLSDFHFGEDKDAVLWFNRLALDLKQELDCRRIDAAIISGDVANKAVDTEYAAAKIFFDKLCAEFDLDPSHLVIVPGNHDLNWDLSEDSYDPVKRKKYGKELRNGRYIEESQSIIQIRDEKRYQKRFAPFSRFYNKVKGESYPLAYKDQGMLYHFKDHNLLILGLNSAWQIDHHFTTRADINPESVSIALNRIGQHPDYSRCLKLAVWHHPLNSPFEDRIKDHGFMELLAQSGFCACFHGHLHRTADGLFRFDRNAGGRRIEVVGAGTFGAPVKEWTPGVPLQYNLLRIHQKRIVVETRRREEINGVWKADARWTEGPGKDPLPRYTIDLMRNFKKKSP